MADPAKRPWYRRALVWELPLLAALGAFMLWVRMIPAKALVLGERAYYIGTDPFFHYRETLGIVRAFPRVPRWDPWTFYPNGTATNQFGTLFDWMAAAYVVVTQGKDAPEGYIAQVLGVYPAVLGALLIVPFYYLAKRLLGLSGAIVAALTLAVLPGEFLIRSIAGYADHHVIEALGAVISILGVYVAAERGHAARLALRAREWRSPLVRKTVLFGLLGGVALGLNFYAWPPALLFLAILTLWLTTVVLIETSRGNDPGGLAFGASISFAVAGVMMIPVMETTDIGDFNAYGLLQVVAPLLCAAWIYALDLVALRMRAARRPAWILPLGIVALAGVALVAANLFAKRFVASILWGLSWVTGFGEPRTTNTIAEARESGFFCTRDAEYNCLTNDFGIVPWVTALLLIALFVWVVWKRRHGDILLLIWSLVIFRATDTQIRFSYYLAINMALLVGWAAARVAEMVSLEHPAGVEREEPVAPSKLRGRRAQRVVTDATRGRPLQVLAVASVLLIVLPGNVVANDASGARPGWKSVEIRQPDGDLVLWLDGLEWMRDNTPDAAVDLSLIVDRPAPGERFDYPDETYGVLSWWDYGHWIETTALRPPVANPFQQAAPFASIYFTERDPVVAEQRLEGWVRGDGDDNLDANGVPYVPRYRTGLDDGLPSPVRYVWIDDEMALGKFSAITVWSQTTNASRPPLIESTPDGARYHPAWISSRTLTVQDARMDVVALSDVYDQSMMARLFDDDANGLSHYRVVYEHPAYSMVGNVVADDGRSRCLHEALGTFQCSVGADVAHYQQWIRDTSRAVTLGDDAHAYDLAVHSRLKLFERVEGAKLTGTATPGTLVAASVQVGAEHESGNRRSWEHTVETVAGPDGAFEIVFPYSTIEPLGPENGGTTLFVRPISKVFVQADGDLVEIDIPERAVLEGGTIPVSFA